MERLPVQRTAVLGMTMASAALASALAGSPLRLVLTRAAAYISGLRRREGLGVSMRTLAVRVVLSRMGSMAVMRPVKVLPGRACRVYSARSPAWRKGRSDS
ncbi:hypothetical protein Barb7_02088 [Bacteroidales bacterium Barb7]|nr:hypothetical protein Barb7_02088 [Bacteroidales bacterium Barb7]